MASRKNLVEGWSCCSRVGVSRNTTNNTTTHMTSQTDSELLTTVLQLLTEQGHQGFAEGIRILVDEAMRRERSAVLQAQPYERSDSRKGQANGFKPKTLTT